MYPRKRTRRWSAGRQEGRHGGETHRAHRNPALGFQRASRPAAIANSRSEPPVRNGVEDRHGCHGPRGRAPPGSPTAAWLRLGGGAAYLC